MSRLGKGGRLKKHNCCATCAVVCFVFLLIFIAAVCIGGNIAFNKIVSPYIGDVKFIDALSLIKGVFTGKQTSPDYSDDDLDSFYSNLSTGLFLSERSNDELQFLLLDDDAKSYLASMSVSPAGDDDSYDSALAYEEFLHLSASDRYSLLSDSMKSMVTTDAFASLNSTDNKSLRRSLGITIYRISASSILDGADFTSSGIDKMLDKTFADLDFNFAALASYDIDNPDASANAAFNSVSLTGKETSAFINDVFASVLNLNISALDVVKNYIPAEKNLTDYLKITSVSIKNTPLAVSGDSAIYNQKDTELSLAICVSLQSFLNDYLSSSNVLSAVPDFAVGMIEKIIPKYLNLSMAIYPLAEDADNRAVRVKINNYNEKDAQNLTKVVDGLMSKVGGKNSAKGFFASLNDTIVKTFSSVNSRITINFIPDTTAAGSSCKMSIMTIDTLVKFLNKDGTISAHDILKMLKCVYVSTSEHDLINLDTAKTEFEGEVSEKYGLASSFFDDHNLLSSEGLSAMLDNLSLADLDYTQTNEAMQIHLSTESLVSLIYDLLGKDDSSTAAAGDSSSNLLQTLDASFYNSSISLIQDIPLENSKIIGLDITLGFDLSKIVPTSITSNDKYGSLITKALPKGKTYLGLRLYIKETIDSNGKISHLVGSQIDKGSIGEGETSAYATAIKLNDFSFDQTSEMLDTVNALMKSLGSNEIKMSDYTESLESSLNDMLSSLSSSDLNLSLSFYTSDGGGILLPSIYELFSSAIAPTLNEGESFTISDAQNILALIYDKTVDKSVYYSSSDATAFLEELNSNYYFSSSNAITLTKIHDDGLASLGSGITANSLDFNALYTDNRSTSALQVDLTGGALASLLAESGTLGNDSFKNVTLLGCDFTENDGKVYLIFDLLCALDKDEPAADGEGDSGLNLKKLFPENVKISASVLLYAPSYVDIERFTTTLQVNNRDPQKLFMMLKSFGGDSLTEESIASVFKISLQSTFVSIENNIPLEYSATSITLADIYSVILSLANITDTTSDELADRLRGFGEQLKDDPDGTALNTSWITPGGIKTFTNTSDDYVYDLMKDVYFMQDSVIIDDTTIFSGFASTFGEIKDTNFKLTGSDGLYKYSGDILTLKVSDRAIGKIVSNNQSIAGAVDSTSDISAEFVGFEIQVNDNVPTFISTLKIAFGPSLASIMPDYFYVIATTTSVSSTYTTNIRINNLTESETSSFFANLSALSSIGLNSSSFNMNDIKNTINSAMGSAIGSLTGSMNINYGKFIEADIASGGLYYNTGTESGDGYIEFPSVYSFLIDLLFPSNRPEEIELQSMLNHLYSDTVESEIISNSLNSAASHITGYSSSPFLPYNGILGYSDSYIGSMINTELSGKTVNGDISLDDTLRQTIIITPTNTALRSSWNNKFNGTSTTNPAFTETSHNYMLVSLFVSLSGYSSGSTTSLLPSNMWMTVLVDLDNTNSSNPNRGKGLLYNMNLRDMELFNSIVSGFDIDNISCLIADEINNAMSSIGNTLSMLGNVVYSYYDVGENITYYDNDHNEQNTIDTITDGIGFLIISIE